MLPLTDFMLSSRALLSIDVCNLVRSSAMIITLFQDVFVI